MQRSIIYGLSVLAFALLLTALVAMGIAQNWGIFRQPAKEDFANADVVNEFALADGAFDLAALDLKITLLPPSSSEEVRQITFQVDEIAFYLRDDDDSVTVTEVCLDSLLFVFNPRSDDTASYTGTRTPACFPVEARDYFEEVVDFETFALDRFYWVTPRLAEPLKVAVDDPDIVGLNFWYPYDGFQTEMAMQVIYSLRVEGDPEPFFGTLYPYVEWNIQTSGTRMWDVTLIHTPQMALAPEVVQELGEDTAYDTYTLTFNRLLLYRIIFPFFMVAMVLLLCFLPLFSERDSLIDVSAALLFGIFGLKGIIGPGGEMGQTIMDIALIGLYVLLAFAVGLFFIRHRAGRGSPSDA